MGSGGCERDERPRRGSASQTSFGLLAVTLTLLLVYVATALITEPWSLTHVKYVVEGSTSGGARQGMGMDSSTPCGLPNAHPLRSHRRSPLRAIASETEIFLSLGILIVITVLSGVAFTPWGTFGLLNVAMVLAVIPFCLWTTLFLYHGVWLPWLLWLPLGGPVLVAFLKFFANEIVEGREEVEKFRALQYKFHKA